MRQSREEILSYASGRRKLCSGIRELIVEQLYLDLDPEYLSDDQPLFGRGLELDSIDALELAVGIYEKYGVTISDGDTSVFGTVNTIADYIQARQAERDQAPAETAEDPDEL